MSIYVNCQKECNNTEGCVFFTFLRHRGEPQCSLLSSCTRCLAEISFIKETKDDSKRNGMRGKNDSYKLLVVGALIYPKTHVCHIEKHWHKIGIHWHNKREHFLKMCRAARCSVGESCASGPPRWFYRERLGKAKDLHLGAPVTS